MTLFPYALLTSARNEERFIEKTIETVLAQTVLPARWVIASDGSTDRTNDIIQSYAAAHPFLRFVYIRPGTLRGVASKINALRQAYQQLADAPYGFIGNLDADITLSPAYFRSLLEQFNHNPSLGLAGGMIYEQRGAEYKGRISNNIRSVAHGAQLLRRECYESIGGYLPLNYGGEDWCAEVSARLRGWHVEAFADLKVLHHRHTGTAERLLSHCFRQGKMDGSFGSHSLFELMKCLRRIPERPLAIGAIARLAGYISFRIGREATMVPHEVVSFLRQEQRQRLRFVLSHPFAAVRTGGNCPDELVT